jgi:hypothetical protein
MDKDWSILEGDSDNNYYLVRKEDGRTVLHAEVPAGAESVTLGKKIPEGCDGHILSWSWRVHRFAQGGNEKEKGKDDTVALYATFGSFLHRQSLKYVWSASLPKGTVVGPRRTVLYDIVTIVLQGPGGAKEWRSEKVDVAADWLRYLGEPGDTLEDAPELAGVGILVDGDDTKSSSAADIATISVDG